MAKTPLLLVPGLLCSPRLFAAQLAGLSKEREDYLLKQAEAQFAVPEEKLVEAVRDVLARHAGPST